jgi:hypothetical protein
LFKYTHNVPWYKGCMVFVVKAMQYIQGSNRHQSCFVGQYLICKVFL